MVARRRQRCSTGCSAAPVPHVFTLDQPPLASPRLQHCGVPAEEVPGGQAKHPVRELQPAGQPWGEGAGGGGGGRHTLQGMQAAQTSGDNNCASDRPHAAHTSLCRSAGWLPAACQPWNPHAEGWAPALLQTPPCLLHRRPKGQLAVGGCEVALQGGGREHERHALGKQAQREGVAMLRASRNGVCVCVCVCFLGQGGRAGQQRPGHFKQPKMLDIHSTLQSPCGAARQAANAQAQCLQFQTPPARGSG